MHENSADGQQASYQNSNSDEHVQQNAEHFGSECDSSQKYNKQSLKKLNIFSQILWLYQPQNQLDYKRIKALMLAIHIIYGQDSVIHFKNQESLTSFIKSKQIKSKKLYHLISKGKKIPLYLVICSQQDVYYFADKLSQNRQIYQKSIVFKLRSNVRKIDKASNCHKLNRYISHVVNQVYDIQKAIQIIQKQLSAAKNRNEIAMMESFNIVLDDNMEDCMEYQKQQVIYCKQDSEPQENLQKNKVQQLNGGILQNQSQVQTQQSLWKYNKTVQQIQMKVSKQLIEMFQTAQVQCNFLPQSQKVALLISDNVKQELTTNSIVTQNLKLIAVSQFKKWIYESQNQPKIILCSQQILPQNLAQCENIFLIIRCQWGELQLSSQQLIQFQKTQFYKQLKAEKQANINSKIVYADRDNFNQIIQKAQSQLQQLMQ